MADVFLSFSSRDRAKVRVLAEALTKQGLDVWWDTSLQGGDDFQRAIMRELRIAKVVVVLWSQSSVTSRFVLMEATEAREQGKLISVLLDDGGPPPEFATLQAIKFESQNELLAAIDRSLDVYRASTRGDRVPTGMPPRGRATHVSTWSLTNLRALQLTTMYWLGIGGAVITLVGNLETFVKLARWLKLVFHRWAEIITLVWRAIIPWRIRVLPEDAVILTLVVILFFNLMITSRHKDVTLRARARDPILLITAALVIFYIAFLGFNEKYDGTQLGLVNTLMAPIATWLSSLSLARFIEPVSFVCMIGTGAVAMTFAYVPFAVALGMRPNINAYAIRLWRIIAGLVIAVIVNQVSVFFESPEWQNIMRP